MGGDGKHRWKISFHSNKSSSSSSSPKSQPPSQFLCPISGSLMFDPVVVSSGQTFERTSVQVCRDLSFVPSLPDGTFPDFDVVIPNLALKSTILTWCNTSNFPPPDAPDYFAIQLILKSRMSKFGWNIRDSERDLLRGVGDKPKVGFSHAATELYPRAERLYSSSSSEESVIGSLNANVPATPLLPFATRPSCYSNSESESDFEATLTNYSFSDETDVITKLNSADVYDQEQVLISLRKKTRISEEARVSLCTSKLLTALKSALLSKYSDVQTNAAALIVNLSLHKANKVKIVRSGIVPPLIDILKGGLPESQEHAAGALFSLALEDENRTAIGVLGALQPLLHALRSDSERTRQDSALALYHLSLNQTNRVKLVKLGAVLTLLTMLKRGELLGRVLLILCNLAMCAEGKSTMLDSNAVDCLVGILRNESESESTRENCVAVLYSLSSGSLRFKGLAREARAVDVLRVVEEKGSERGREKAKRMLMMLRERDEGEDEEVDWEGVLEGGVSRNRYRVGRKVHGPNSTEF
ncbi:RING-type E3 ubiquitin transferase [Heracleum sosnowskyi]|uniref:RING-type E3 ubiquitin transferase n=1 Tax=Heracleum sosnowskyi TaxID=360622 RepID=A0AAD8HU39_9APIA|nr:RING-type E3 ubiquitin transferase [Heracleum sosnowskyi]